MSRGPFPVNSSLVFSVASGEVTTDGVTGNAIVATTEVEIQASLTPLGDAASGIQKRLGIDATGLSLQGRCVEPMTVPSGIVSGQPCQLTYGGKTSQAWIIIPPRSRWNTEASLGDLILVAFERPN